MEDSIKASTQINSEYLPVFVGLSSYLFLIGPQESAVLVHAGRPIARGDNVGIVSQPACNMLRDETSETVASFEDAEWD